MSGIYEEKDEGMEVSAVTSTLKKYYEGKIVTALVGIKTDVNRVDQVAKNLSGNKGVEDIFIVTGDFDIVIKVRFPEFWNLQEFLVEELSKLPGVKESKTMMVLSTIKDMGRTFGR
jgi:Lrp/AsnC family leucine-responsive transcriptional regulator